MTLIDLFIIIYEFVGLTHIQLELSVATPK